MAGLLIAATDHAAERYAQRVRGTLDPKGEIVARVSRAWEAGRREAGDRGTVRVADVRDPALVFVCRHDVPRGELVVVTLWEEGDDARVPRRYTDVLRRACRVVMRRPGVVLVLLVALAGCGSMSAADYRAAAKRICTDSDRRSSRVTPPTRSTPEAIADYFRRQLAINDENVERFRELDPPGDLQKAHDRAVDAAEAAGDEVRRIVAQLDEGRDPGEVLSAAKTRLERVRSEQRSTAQALGVEACAD